MAQPTRQPQLPQQQRDILDDLARHTEMLEAQLGKLKGALDHWRLLEAEYEALSDEVRHARSRGPVSSGSETTTPLAVQTELVRIRRDFDGQLVDHETVCELFGARTGQTITRSVDHIARAIGRRLDYVRQNAATLQKQVEAAANKLAVAQVVSRPGMPAIGGEGDEDGELYAVTDIVEELDDDDNVVNVQLNTPSNTQPQVLAALEKAGVDKMPASVPATAAAVENNVAPESSATPEEPVKARTNVSFADDTKAGHGEDEEGGNTAGEMSFAAQRVERIMRSAKDQEALVNASSAVIPADESSDDAALRREMLEYSMSQIGPIVAQLDIDEMSDGDSENDEDEGYNDDEYDDDDGGSGDDEDQYGRSKYSVIDKAYREQMRELEKRLGVAPLDASAMAAAAAARDEVAESLGRIRISGSPAASETNGHSRPTQPLAKPVVPLTSAFKSAAKGEGVSSSAKPSSKGKESGRAKKVSFASALDVATAEAEPTPAAAAAKPPQKQPTSTPSEPLVEPLSDVVERVRSAARPAAEPAKPPKRVSRFKMARAEGGGSGGGGAAAAPPATTGGLPKGPLEAPVRFLDQEPVAATPEGPEGLTHAATVVERQAVTQPKEPSELGATILLQETATEYHRTRNRLIQQQGGFLQASQAAVVPVGEEDGGPHISKFKAARLGQL